MANRKSPPLDPGAIPWLLAVALATAAPHASHLPVWLSLSAVGALIWRAWLWRTHARLPARWLLAFVVLAGVAAIGLQFGTLFGRDCGVALIVFFMAMKPLEMSTRRDSTALVMLGFFLLLTHYFYSQSIVTGLWLLAATTLLVATLIRINGGPQSPLAIARYAGLLLAQALPLLLILFVLFPRVTGPLWGLPLDAHTGRTGLSERMSPGSLNRLIESGAIAFRVEFAGQIPPPADRYWRGPVLDDYDGLTWSAVQRGARPPATTPGVEARGPIYHYVSTLEANNQRWLLALDLPLTTPPGSMLTRRFETLANEPLRARARFALSSAPLALANRDEDPTLLQLSLRLPPQLNPRSRELAQSWRSRFISAQQISDQALRYFADNAFIYTLRPPLLGPNAVDDFLFVTRRGFCEHYAAAYVVLMRAAGIPARVVTGYQGGEINPVDGYLTVRQSDAHAWAEIWIAGRGWQRVDPTAAVAPSRIELGIDAALPADEPLPALVRIDSDWLRALRNRFEAANNRWNQWVLGYNPQRQRELLSTFGVADPDWRRMSAALAVLGAIALAIVASATLRQRDRTTPAQRAWQRFCQRLARLGVVRQDWEGPHAFAARVAREKPPLAMLCREAADLYAQLHYGVGTSAQLQELKNCTRRLPSSWRKTR